MWGLLNCRPLLIAASAVEFEIDMRIRSRSLKVIAMMLFASSVIVGCGTESSPLESMKAPIHLVRNDSITEVKDSAGKLYTLNTFEKSDYRTAFLKPGDEITVKAAQ